MSLLPRRGAGRHGQHGVAVHPGWTLTPTSVTDALHERPTTAELPVAQPTSRWTSTLSTVAAEPVPAAAPVPVLATAPAPVPVAAPVPVPAPVPAPAATPTPAPVEPAATWASEWEAIAATPAPGAPVSALHTAAATALDAVFGATALTTGWAAGPLQSGPAVAPTSTLTALDSPFHSMTAEAATPLAAEAARAIPPRTIPVVAMPLPPLPAPPTVPPPAPARPVAPTLPARSLAPTLPAPPTSPPPRTVLVPAPAQQLVEQAIRTAPAAPVQRRSTVRLGFTDASVIDLRPDDPIAKALHTVATALMSRER